MMLPVNRVEDEHRIVEWLMALFSFIDAAVAAIATSSCGRCDESDTQKRNIERVRRWRWPRIGIGAKENGIYRHE